jgi:hypothetical protein
MIERKRLLGDLQTLLKGIEADLLERSGSSEVAEVGRRLREEYAAAQAAARTAQSFEEWRSDQITQVAAAWVLSCVFVRFLEDNELIATPKIAGPGERLRWARDEHELYFRAHPTLTDREYLLSVFDDLARFSATKDVFGPHNPVRDLPNWLSGDAAGTLIEFLQRIDAATGDLVHDFTDPAWDTRFLGDLYQDLSEAARKKYALLQTPVFVEEFILDRTLDPAIEEFGLAKPGYETRLEPDGRLHPNDRFRMIDPACGSGHFLLGSFARLVERWRQKEPGAKDAVLAQRAMDSVHGIDLNPYAIAIARFRLLLAALKECGVRRLKDAPGFGMHLACGDSLLHGAPGGDQETMGWSPLDHVYQPEDHETLQRLLRPRGYHSVVANPPYITPKDRALNQAYRDRYSRTCHMKYSLAVPFMQRIVSLAVERGFTGQITANSFMKREFGKKLIEMFFPRVDLTHVIDTSGAYIPGHGTPTVILFARNQAPVKSTIRTVMGIRGEPSTPDDPARGLVWSAIIDQVDEPGSHREFVSVADSPRELFHKHPWSIGGGGAAELKELLEESAALILSKLADEIGVLGMTNADEVMLAPGKSFRRRAVEQTAFRRLAFGDEVRDWQITCSDCSLFPYNDDLIDIQQIRGAARWLWPTRTVLGNRATFSRLTYFEEGRPWWEWHQVALRRLRTPLSIVLGEVATHNHFVLDRGGKVFKQTAPVIKLPSGATEEDHLSVLGLLNSSTACFWLKQVCFPKGGDHVGQEGARVRRSLWDERYAFNATNIGSFPLPGHRPPVLARQLDDLAQRLQMHAPFDLLSRWQSRGIMPGNSIKESFQTCEREWTAIREKMIALQEELDWKCYRLYGLIEEDLTCSGEPPPLRFGGRAFEISMGAKMAEGEFRTTWFERHNATPLPGPHPEWPEDYQALVRRRMEVIATDSNIALIEQPEYKRRWNTEPWADQLARALRSWLLDRLESYLDFDGRMNEEHGKPTARLPIGLVSVGRLADVARQDETFHEVAALYRDDPAFDVSRLVAELIASESVPLLPILRYKPTGLRKRAEWEKTWELQRQEDSIDARTKLPKDHADFLSEIDARDLKKRQIGNIPVPPKYTSADFLDGDYWRLRGKLDVAKERWVSFPHCEGEDGTLTVAWAGYDHLQLARSVSAYYVDVQERLGGRDDPRLVPLLACLVELLPWLKQWHNEVDPEFGVPMGDYFEGFLQEESRNLGLTLDEIRAWQPPQRAARGRRRANG